jgi:hypothetical protein
MKITIIIVTLFTLVLASTAFAGDVIGRHTLPDNRGLVRVRSINGNKMAFDVIYAHAKGELVILTDVFADYNPQTQKAVYSEDRFCPDALKITFQRNGRVILREAACAQF